VSHAPGASTVKRTGIPPYVVISILTFLTIGPQYVLNVSFILNQPIIQNGFSVGSYALIVPSLVSNLAFSLCVPLGPVLARHFGLRRSYLALVLAFFCGSLMSAGSPEFPLLTLGRTIQGLCAGALFLTILPVSLISFPNRVRNWFLLLAIGGLFGSSAIGAVLGSLSLRADAWRLFYLLCGVPALLCFIMGYRVLPKQEVKEHAHHPLDVWGLALLVAALTTLVFPLANLQKWGLQSTYVWPYLVLACVLFAAFVWVELSAHSPLVHFRALHTPKQLFGFVMAIAGHVALIAAMVGSAGFLRTVKAVAPVSLTQFYLCFIAGTVLFALLSVWLYDRIGAGGLGILGSIAILVVSIAWRSVQPAATLSVLEMQMGCLGAAIGVVLVAGALGTALAGDIHQARWRSVALHFTRNVIGGVAVPVFGWMVYTRTAVHYEMLRSQVSLSNPQVSVELASMIQRLEAHGMEPEKAKALASYLVAANAKTASLLSAYHDLFTVLLVVGAIMMLASIGMALSGKDRRLVQREAPPASHLIRDVSRQAS
jgi:MFS family permease